MVRYLTPEECARLQSCPDDMAWPDEITKKAKYQIIGNGWACGMAAAMSRALGEVFIAALRVPHGFLGHCFSVLAFARPPHLPHRVASRCLRRAPAACRVAAMA